MLEKKGIDCKIIIILFLGLGMPQNNKLLGKILYFVIALL